jgi:hypothetical protein
MGEISLIMFAPRVAATGLEMRTNCGSLTPSIIKQGDQMKLQTILLGFILVAGAQAAIDGTWETACINSNNQYGKNVLTVTGANMNQVSYAYGDAACATQWLTVEMSATAQYGADSQIVAGAKELDVVVSKVYLTGNESRIVDYLNQNTFCGFSDWAINQQKDITGLTCGEETMPKTGDPYYDIYGQLQDGKLALGLADKEYDGKTVEKRVRHLDTEHPLTKK